MIFIRSTMHLRRYWHSDRGDLSTRVLLLPEAACLILNEVRKYRPKELCRDLGSMKYAVHSQVVIAVVLPETEVMRMSYYEIRLKTERPSARVDQMNAARPAAAVHRRMP